jgi:hypothetical protein
VEVLRPGLKVPPGGSWSLSSLPHATHLFEEPDTLDEVAGEGP